MTESESGARARRSVVSGSSVRVLIEVHGAKGGRPLDFALPRSNLTAEQAQQRRFAASIGADQAYAHARGDGEIQILDQRAAFDPVADMVEMNQALGLSIGRREVDIGGPGAASPAHIGQLTDQLIGFVDARFGLGGASFGAAAEPFHFDLYAILQGLLMFRLRF